MTTGWRGVIPAVTTQFNEDLSIDFENTRRVQDALVNDGVHGLIVMGTCGENNSLDPDEKRAILKGAVEVVAGIDPAGQRGDRPVVGHQPEMAAKLRLRAPFALGAIRAPQHPAYRRRQRTRQARPFRQQQGDGRHQPR